MGAYKKINRWSCNEESMKEAAAFMHNEKSLRKASIDFNEPKLTLRFNDKNKFAKGHKKILGNKVGLLFYQCSAGSL